MTTTTTATATTANNYYSSHSMYARLTNWLCVDRVDGRLNAPTYMDTSYDNSSDDSSTHSFLNRNGVYF